MGRENLSAASWSDFFPLWINGVVLSGGKEMDPRDEEGSISFLLVEPVLGAGNNIVLDVFPKIREVSAITGHADHQRGVIFRMFLSIDQDRFIDAIELNMGNTQVIQGGA